MTSEGQDILYRAWDYLLKTYKVNDELPEEFWDAEEIFKQLIWDIGTEMLERGEL